MALWVLAGAVFIDSIDGTLARQIQIKVHAPQIDGGLMDNIVDFTTWTIAPLFWLYGTMHLPVWVLIVCATASLFGFSNMSAKTEDHFFTGFPSYWNIVAVYLYLLHFPAGWASVILLFFAISVFLPIKFVYPSRTRFLKQTTLVLCFIFIIHFLVLIYFFDDATPLLIYSSFLFPVYYFGLSFYLNLTSFVTS